MSRHRDGERADPVGKPGRSVGGSAIVIGLAAALLLPVWGRDAAIIAETPEVDAAYLAEVDAWRQDRNDRLRDPNGWLTLVGLHWLRVGENPAGSDADARVRLTKGPDAMGLFRLAPAGRLRFEPVEGTDIRYAGERLDGPIEMRTDADGTATHLEWGSLTFYAIKRQNRVAIRVKDRESDALRGFEGVDHFAVDPHWRVEARFETYDPPKTITVPTVYGDPFEEEIPGAVVFEHDGKRFRIDALPGADGELFLIFGDTTNGETSYGAGRFLYTDPPEDGRVTVDFNLAYNPPCAFTAFATCPLPPPQNKLDVAIPAGEKNYKGFAH
ncbi:MAG: DUF1684 domain-containing protein [Acidobacteriota bacterium]